MNERDKEKYRRVAQAHLLLAAADAPDHLIRRVRALVEVELRNGARYEFSAEGWV
jgi:hypothetical protein